MNPRDRDLFMASRFENSGTPEDRARAIRIRAREARRLARERQGNGQVTRQQRGKTR